MLKELTGLGLCAIEALRTLRLGFRDLNGSRRALLYNDYTHRLLGSSFLGLPYRILNMNPKKELLRSLWVVCCTTAVKC